MNISTILQHFVEKSSFNAIKDKRRLKAVLDCTEALSYKENLTLTGLGRAMVNTSTKTRHCIKRVCRLLGNPHLQQERRELYGFIASHLLKNSQHPLIIVDWSPVNHADKQILRASLPIGGRSFTLYEEVHPEKKQASLLVHQEFIRRLSEMIPEGVKPVVTTDAGFKVPWFKPIEAQGWYWLGRLRSNSQVLIQGTWQSRSDLYQQATCKPCHLGDAELTKAHRHPSQMVLYRKKPKGRKSKNLYGQPRKDGENRLYAKSHNDPWILVTNLEKETWFSERIVALYSQRMQIEESFRDTKNERYGLALNYCGSRCLKRVEILLMIAMLTQFALLLIGKAAYIKGYYKDFQANSIRYRRVLSYFFLGKEIISKPGYYFSVLDILQAFAFLKTKFEAELG